MKPITWKLADIKGEAEPGLVAMRGKKEIGDLSPAVLSAYASARPSRPERGCTDWAVLHYESDLSYDGIDRLEDAMSCLVDIDAEYREARRGEKAARKAKRKRK